MNPTMPFIIRASLVVALLLPLAGCGNKGPLVLPQNPPAENASAESTPMLPTLPPMGETLPLDGVPADDAPPPADDAPPPADDVPAPPPSPPSVPVGSDNGNG